MDEMPRPPFPDPRNYALRMICEGAFGKLNEGLSPRMVVIHAVVHAWMEGHLEGHACPGDETEPGNPSVRRALREGRLEDADAIAREMGVDDEV